MLKRLLTLAFCAAFLGNTARAAILFNGGEDTSFISVGGASTAGSGNSTTYDTNFARASVAAGNSTTVADPPAIRWQTPTFTANSHVWFHANFNAQSVTTTANEQAIIFRSPDGVSRIVFRQTGTNGQLKVSSRNAAGTITDLATFTGNYSLTTTTQLDIEVNYTCSGSGAINAWYANVQVLAFTGNPCTDSATQLNQVDFASVNNGSNGGVGCQSGGASTCWSEVIVATSDTRSMRVVTLAPQSAGNTQAWTPNTLANINKISINDTTFIGDPTGNLLSQWKAPTTAPAGTWTVKTVSLEARLLKSVTGPTQFDWSWRISNSDYLAGQSNALTSGFLNYRLQQDTSPATSSAWTMAEIFNTSTNQMNFGVKSLP